jgi:hypothetical protein
VLVLNPASALFFYRQSCVDISTFPGARSRRSERVLATEIYLGYLRASTPETLSMPNTRKLPRRKRELLSYEDVVQLLRAEIDRAGTESEWARRTGANRTSLNLALKGRVGLQKNILDALGLKKVVVVAYEPARRP